jgi:cell division protein FtsI (penicillin-binding protein 3)
VYIANYRRRIQAVFLLLFLLLVFCIARLLFIQFFRSAYLSDIAKKQHNQLVELEPRRGNIFDAHSRPQAVNLAMDSLFACPNDIPASRKEVIINKLLPILKVSRNFLTDRLSRKKSFVWLARKISTAQSQEIRNLKLKGIGFIKESKRSYPNGYLASQIIGFADLDNRGLEGSELIYDRYLKGESGWVLMLRDARQNKLDIYENMLAPKDGYDLHLNIDEVIQYIAERELGKAFNKYNAKGASIVILEPTTGKILAMANYPTYDPNEYSKAGKDQMRNRAITDLFEPGSVFKIVTASAALEEAKFSEEDKIFCENGTYRVANHILHDHTSHGLLTFREVIEQSSNIGTTKIAQNLGKDIIYRYAKLFGFGAKSGVDLTGEITGMVKETRLWSKTSIGAIPIGQEVGVTALQLACSISVIANGGSLMRPYLVSQITDKRGQIIKEFTPKEIRKVISADTAARMKKILTGVVENGTGKMARVNGFSVAGKTGTAQKLEPNGAYSHSKFVASFIGFAPAEEPVIAMAVVVDEPHPAYFGGVVSAPVFKNVAEQVLRYLKNTQTVNEGSVLNEAGAAN